MLTVRMMYRDVDRLPYLYGLRRHAETLGLTISLVRYQQFANVDWGEMLVNGEVDAIAENYWALQRYRAAGRPFATVASSSHVWTESLLARPGIAALDDLRGKKLAVRLTGPQHAFPWVLLQRAGLLDAVELVVYSEQDTGRWGHWKKVADGTCDACFMVPLYDEGARAAGLVDVPYEAFAFDGAHIVPTTTEDFIAANPEAIRLLVEAMFETCERINADAGWFRERVVESLPELREHFPLGNDREIDRVARILRAEIATIPIPTPEGIKNAYDVASVQYPEVTGFNSLLMWDLSFARAAYRKRETRR